MDEECINPIATSSSHHPPQQDAEEKKEGNGNGNVNSNNHNEEGVPPRTEGFAPDATAASSNPATQSITTNGNGTASAPTDITNPLQTLKTDKTAAQAAKSSSSKSFICGVIEGFYGRPWTTEQRKDLFRK